MVLFDLGRIYMYAHRLDDAEKALTRAIEIRPYDFVPRWYLVRLYVFGMHDAAKARAALTAAEPLAPNELALRRERDALARIEAGGTVPPR
jgi:cytochrome c-type biogenesis protein CcmH/NrfG